jgi:dTDP-4-dehydrorhamnose 3,5-epimerase
MDAGRPFSPTELIVISTETMLKGAFVIDLDRKQDLRGFFARAFCQHEFKAYRFQFPLAAETKLVRCTRGGIVDLRPESSTYLKHVSVELNEDNHRRFVPERFAHGYQTLHDNTDTSYSVGEFYTPADEDGILYNDPRLGLQWPLPVTVFRKKTRSSRRSTRAKARSNGA